GAHLGSHSAVTGASIVPTPNPSPTEENHLTGASCVSSSFCMAVGTFDTKSNAASLITRWNGNTWAVVPSSDTGATTRSLVPADNALNVVSCASVSFCMAVGDAQGPAIS